MILSLQLLGISEVFLFVTELDLSCEGRERGSGHQSAWDSEGSGTDQHPVLGSRGLRVPLHAE